MKTFKYLLLIFCLASTTCFAEILDRVVASIDGAPVSESEIISELKKITASSSVQLPIPKEGIKSALTSILLNKEAERLGISVSQDELDQQLNDIVTRSQISKEEFEKTLIANGLSLSQYRDKLATELNRSRVITTVLKSRVQVSEDELNKYVGDDKTKLEDDAEKFGLLKFTLTSGDFNQTEEINKIKGFFDQGGLCDKYNSSIVSSCQFLGVVKAEDLKEAYSEALKSVEQYKFTEIIPEEDSQISLMKVSNNFDVKQSTTKLSIKEKLFQDKFKGEAEKYLDKELFDKYAVEIH